MKRFLPFKVYPWIIIPLFTTALPAFSGNNETNNDVRSLALGSPMAMSRELSNPAAISFLHHPIITIGVYNQFQMEELNTYNLTTLIPNRILDAGIRLSRFGYEDYNTLTLESGMAKKLNSKISLGAKISYLSRYSFLEDKTENGIKAGLGGIFRLSESVNIGVLADNLAATLPGKNYSFHAGVDYAVITDCTILMEISSNAEKQFRLVSGIDYGIAEQFYIRAGIHTNPTTPSLGAAWLFNRFSIAASFISHQTLGNSTCIEVSYSF